MQQFRMLAENVRCQVRHAGLDAAQRDRDIHCRGDVPQARTTLNQIDRLFLSCFFRLTSPSVREIIKLSTGKPPVI